MILFRMMKCHKKAELPRPCQMLLSLLRTTQSSAGLGSQGAEGGSVICHSHQPLCVCSRISKETYGGETGGFSSLLPCAHMFSGSEVRCLAILSSEQHHSTAD